MDGGAWRAMVHGVTKSQMRLRAHTLSVCPSIYVSLHQSIHPSVIYLCIYYLSLHPLSIYYLHLSIYLPILSSIHLFIYISIYHLLNHPQVTT